MLFLAEYREKEHEGTYSPRHTSMAISVRLAAHIEQRLDYLSAATGHTKMSHFATLWAIASGREKRSSLTAALAATGG
jgi:predicted transcriptional regulator